MSNTVASIAIGHILKCISSRVNPQSPLFVGLQGPQGSGKTTVARALVEGLTSAPHSLKVAAISIDDLYFAHEELQAVGRDNPGNGLLQGRGLPGTHDVPLGVEVLQSLFSRGIKKSEASDIRVPVYDKSLHHGLGDRLPVDNWTMIRPPVDVVIFEGWCFGFQPCPLDKLAELWERRTDLGMPESVILQHGIEDIKLVGKKLEKYADAWYKYFTCFIQVAPLDGLGVIYKWRLQQEHSMKAGNGGIGMSDEQVARFIDRYIPGYIFFDDPSVQQEGNLQPWHGNGLKIIVDENRAPVATEVF